MSEQAGSRAGADAPRHPMHDGADNRSEWLDWLIPAGLALTILLCAVLVSRRVPFWSDEILTWVEVSDPSLPHMLRAISDGAESAPPLYHIIAWFWSRLFGASEMALRLFTASGFAAAVVTAWITLRRPFGRFGASVAAAAAFGGSELILNLNRQGRFYGLFMFEAALIVYLMSRIAREGASRKLGVALFAAHVALLYTHIFGIVYSVALGGAILLWDLLTVRRPRFATSGAVVLAWLAFLPWLPSFARQREVAKPSLWIPRVGLHDLFVSAQFGVTLLPLCVTFLGAMLILTLQYDAPRRAGTTASSDETMTDRSRLLLLMTAALLLTVPVGIWLMQVVTSPVFVPRYMIPSVLGLAIGLAAVAQRAWPRDGVAVDARGSANAEWRGTATRVLGGALLLVLMGFPLYYAAAFPGGPRQDTQLAAAIAGVPAGTPVVAELIVDFAPLWFYQGRVPGKVYFLDDSASTLLPGTALGGLSAIKNIRSYARNGYFPGVLISPDTLFARHATFLVIDQPRIMWFEQRIAPDARFRNCAVGLYQEMPLRLVTRADDALCDQFAARADGLGLAPEMRR